jgi:hypothetical protein
MPALESKMNDQEMTVLVQQWQKRLEQQFTEMKLRQWCVEQAIKLCEAGAPGAENYSQIYQDLLKFISAPFAEIFNPPTPGSQ